jgi:hypothetical protein
MRRTGERNSGDTRKQQSGKNSLHV